MSRKIRWYDFLILYLYPLLFYRGYYFVGFNLNVLKLAQFFLTAFLILYIGKFWFVKSCSRIFNIFRLLFFANVLSIFMSFLFWGQSLSMGFRATVGQLMVLYFFLVKKNFTIGTIKRFTFFWGGLWLFIYLVAYIAFPIPLFTQGDDFELQEDLTRGVVRFFIVGDEVLYLMLFYVVNKFVVDKRKKWGYFCAIAFLSIVVVMQVTRQTILFSGIIILIYLLVNSKKIVIPLLVLILASPLILTYIQETSIYEGLSSLTAEQKNDKEENVRISEYRYYVLDFPQSNPLTWLLGNGMPHADSYYGKMEDKVRMEKGYYRSDVGYASMFVGTGLWSWMLMALLLFSVIKTRVPTDYAYIKMFTYFMFLYNIASAHFYGVFICIALYMLTYFGRCEIKNKRIC